MVGLAMTMLPFVIHVQTDHNTDTPMVQDNFILFGSKSVSELFKEPDSRLNSTGPQLYRKIMGLPLIQWTPQLLVTGSLGSKILYAVCVGGTYSLPVDHSNMSQLQASVSTCTQKRADNSGCYAITLPCGSLHAADWLVLCVSEEACVW